ncbi:hypothetical protein M2271_001282 [Streptomyces sp. LBL]|uniref:DUF3344 domain-containing protein n=1 Tax=Streptomyces sp. LBL TaxID=2940562 RepID=UPI00247718DC|nr:DUF3344 domain-containing protein [Streptomyces sp. LBL]MDH6623495.1 hypothetical protein [Streptomyces sp. LBL]
MRNSLFPPLRHATVATLALAGICAPGALAAPAAPPSPEKDRLPFTERYHALQHGGIVRAANASVSCRAAQAVTAGSKAPSCSSVRKGKAAGVNGHFGMTYIDVDKDPNTYNSSRAEVRLPKGSRVSYARLYWGGNLRVGEQKPQKDNGRVLIAEPGGAYKELLADTVVGHRVANGADAFQASANVTRLVRDSKPGLYTVAQVNVAKGRSRAGAWGGWTLVVAYENRAQPLRRLALWDGFDALHSRNSKDSKTGLGLGRFGLRFPAGAGGRAGLVTYDGDRGLSGESLRLTTTRRAAGAERTAVTALTGPANPRGDVLNSTISQPGTFQPKRVPAYANTLGYDSDVFDLAPALRHGGNRLAFRLTSPKDQAWAGALFAAVDAQR